MYFGNVVVVKLYSAVPHAKEPKVRLDPVTNSAMVTNSANAVLI